MLQREERDVINVAQAEAFACTFGLPLIRWRLDMVDEIDNKLLRDDVYEDEDHLWGYFVEGAPVNLTPLTSPPAASALRSDRRGPALELQDLRAAHMRGGCERRAQVACGRGDAKVGGVRGEIRAAAAP